MIFNKNVNDEEVEVQEEFNDVSSKQLELKVIELRAQLEGIKKYVSNSEAKNKSIEKAVTNFCRNLLQREYALSQLGGSEENTLAMNINELLDFTARKILEEKSEQKKMVLQVISEKEEKDNLIDSLKNQITQFLSSKNLAKKEILEIVFDSKINNPSLKYSEDDEVKPKEPNELKPNHPLLTKSSEIDKEIKKEEDLTIITEKKEKEQTPVRVIEVRDEDLVDRKVITETKTLKNENKDLKSEHKTKYNNLETIKKEEVIPHVIDLTKIMNNMAEIHWKILEAIGVLGLSEKSDMIVALKKYYEKLSQLENKVDSALEDMKLFNVVTREKVNTGWRVFYVYSLSDVGKRIFVESKKFEGEPVPCERDNLTRQHSTSNHGYGIKDCANILTELGYKNVCYDNKLNKVDLPNGDIYIPDIIAEDKTTGEKRYFEYELVHHKQSDFDIKCNKMRKVTNDLYFIVPDVKKRARILNQIDDWRFTMGDKVKYVNVFVTTTRNLKKDKWDLND